MDFFVDHAVGFALACAAVAVLYGLYLTWWLLQQPAGNERMQEIARAIRRAAAATCGTVHDDRRRRRSRALLPARLLQRACWGTAFASSSLVFLRRPASSA